MALFHWQQRFLSGFQEIDEHHIHLVGLLNTAYDDFRDSVPRERLDALFLELIDYATYHFAAEERLMKESGYPALDAHDRQHRQFTARVTEMHRDYLAGKPVFRHENMTIGMENLDFSISTKNVLVKTGSWIFKSGLLQKLASNLVFPVGQNLEDARTELNAYLEKGLAEGYFKIDGSVGRLDVDKLLVAPGSVKAYFQFEGKVKVTMTL